MSAVTCQNVTNGSHTMPWETSGPRSPRSQSGWLEDQPRRPPDDRVRRVLQVDQRAARPRAPGGRPRSGASSANRTVRPSSTTGSHSGDPASRSATMLAPQLVEVRRPGPQHAVRAVLDVGEAAEGGLPAEGAEALAEHVELRARVGRQLRPGAVDRVEQRAAGVARLDLVDQEGHPAGQVGVLHRDHRGVAVELVLERVARRRVDPAGPGRRDDHQHRPVEAAGPLELADGERGPVADVLGAGQPDVGADRLLGRPAGERLELARASAPSRRSCAPAGPGPPTAPGTPGCRTARTPSARPRPPPCRRP